MKRLRPRRALVLVIVLAAAGTAACGEDHEFEPPDRDSQRTEARQRFEAAVFDTLAWSSDSARRVLGEEVFATKCRKCHGYLGRGGTEYAARRNLEVPSLVEPDWPYAGKPDSARRRIFVGHSEMPSFGLRRVNARQIDAVTYYVLEVLRPDVLEERSDAGSG